MKKISRHYWISGHVQGVGYRAFTLHQARRLGIVGWVRNSVDGRVEIVASGGNGQLAKLELQLGQGSAYAKVEDIKISEHPIENHVDFVIRADA